jgi:hypothetical protein
MPNPILTKEQLVHANELLSRIRTEIEILASNDKDLLFAYRRKIAKMLTYDERSGPNERRKLKTIKYVEQKGLCAECQQEFPKPYSVLDRFSAIDGYTATNTRLLCEKCDRTIQAARGYK